MTARTHDAFGRSLVRTPATGYHRRLATVCHRPACPHPEHVATFEECDLPQASALCPMCGTAGHPVSECPDRFAQVDPAPRWKR